MHNPDPENKIFNLAAGFIQQTNKPVFLTGKAGTGKTTFLKFIKEQRFKNTVVVAPTGVAAINAGGTTIHSFFSLPFTPFIPIQSRGFSGSENMDKNSLLSRLKLNQDKRELMQELELLVIDEISMVRCDVLDAIDLVLRHVRNRYSTPFGGVQVLYIGDMYQLPPVVKDEEWNILSKYYSGPFFFNSQVCNETPPVYIELNKVYRQTDHHFINLLNQVRNNEMDEEGYQLLHSRYQENFLPVENAITLTTHNHKADVINDTALSRLTSPEYIFKATVEGEFYEKSFPAEEMLRLKEGSQVMFLKNDVNKKYFNGKIGVLEKIDGEKLFVKCHENGIDQNIEVGKETWKTIRYSLNKSSNQVEEEELGSFTQYPLRLAWAITIHKSQGLTFTNAIIDAGQAFSPGQVYVALSRCTSIDGLILRSRIGYQSLRSDERIVNFSTDQKKLSQVEQILENSRKSYETELLLSIFDLSLLKKAHVTFSKFVQENFNNNSVTTWLHDLTSGIDVNYTYSQRFINQVSDAIDINSEVKARYTKAANWFKESLGELSGKFLKCPAVSDNRGISKEFQQKASAIFDHLQLKIFLMGVFEADFSLENYYLHKTRFKKPLFPLNIYAGKAMYVSPDIKNPELYRLLKAKREELAELQNSPIFMICSTESLSQMSEFLPHQLAHLDKISGFGKSRIKRFGQAFLEIIRDYIQAHDLTPDIGAVSIKQNRKVKSLVNPKTDTKTISYELYRQGKTILEIAKERNFATSTIEGHLASFIEEGKIKITELMPGEKVEKHSILIKQNPGLSLSEIKTLEPSLGFNEIRWLIAHEKSGSS